MNVNVKEPPMELIRCGRCSTPSAKVYRLVTFQASEAAVAPEEQDERQAELVSEVAFGGDGPIYCRDCLEPGLSDAAALLLVRIVREDPAWSRSPDRWVASLLAEGPSVPGDWLDTRRACVVAGAVVVKALAVSDVTEPKDGLPPNAA